MRKTILLTAMALLLPAAAMAMPGDHTGKLAGMFSPEQRAVYMMGFKDQVRDMTPEQRKAFRHDQVAKVLAMNESDRTRMKSDLQRQWDALPQARKDRLEQRIAMHGQNGRYGAMGGPNGMTDNTPIGIPRQ